MRDALSDSEEFAIISLDDLLESSDIPIVTRVYECNVVNGRRYLCRLSRVLSHTVVASIIHANSDDYSPLSHLRSILVNGIDHDLFRNSMALFLTR